MNHMSISEKTSIDKYELDETSHIKVNKEICSACTEKYCVSICPAGVYSLNEAGHVDVDHAGCFECGTCTVACGNGGLTWNYPRGGAGIIYRFA